MDFEVWLYVIVILGAASSALFLFYTMRGRRVKGEESLEAPEIKHKWPTKAKRVVSTDEFKRARDDLRTFGVEREILSYAIRHLYEAQAEERISEEERDHLTKRYKERIAVIKDAISRNESIVALQELEIMREDLLKLFSERFDEVNNKIDGIRARVGIKPVVETLAPPAPVEKEEKKRASRPRSTPPKKTEAEKRIEEIRSEVEQVLERLGQIEVEE